MPSIPSWFTAAFFVVDLLVRLGIGIRVLMRRLPVGVTLSWLLLVLGFPVGGPLLYLLFGELRLGDRRARRAAMLHQPFLNWLLDANSRNPMRWGDSNREAEPLARLVERVVGLPPLPGNELELMDSSESILRRLIADIEGAQRTCHLAFYIWSNGGLADEVAVALQRAAGRGVRCRLLVDDVGSKAFLRSEMPRRLEDSGVTVRSALAVSLLRMLFVRFDLRLHRKIVVIDGEVAYTGSMNLVDPRYFKQDAAVGEWVDAMVRVQGPAVEALAVTFLEDWALETGETIEQLRGTGGVEKQEAHGTAPVQVFPSGPMHDVQAIEAVLIMAIYSARREVVLTTPYFVPEEAMVRALMTAALRGVAVTLIMPARVDSTLVRLASQTFQGDLAEAGVHVMLFEGGLLHTKSVTVDGEMSLFGSLNLDPRSLRLNFEITLLVYDAAFTAGLRRLQQVYEGRSRMLDVEAWQGRNGMQRLAANTARLLSPLL